MLKALFVAVVACSLCGCASIIAGTSQDITVSTEPAGADCELVRKGVVIGSVLETPGSVHVTKTKYDIAVYCRNAGYRTAVSGSLSGIEIAAFGDAIAGGPIGWGVDSALGADNHYDSPVIVRMIPARSAPRAGLYASNAAPGCNSPVPAFDGPFAPTPGVALFRSP